MCWIKNKIIVHLMRIYNNNNNNIHNRGNKIEEYLVVLPMLFYKVNNIEY